MSYKTLCWASSIALCAATLTARAASFDCSAATRPIEKVICATPRLNVADETMGRLYRAALHQVSAPVVTAMRADQVQWLAYIQQICFSPDSVAAVPLQAGCLQPLYADRVRVLRAAATQRDGVRFYTRSEYFAVPDKRAELDNVGQYPAFATLEASWPVADSTEASWQAWNRALEIRVLLIAGAGEEDTTKQMPVQPATWSENLVGQRNTQVIALLNTVEHGRVTTALSSEAMGRPAAHPSDAYESVTWLLSAGRALQATDVFAPGDTWERVVAADCWAALTTSDRKDYLFATVTGPASKPIQDVIRDTHNWTLEKDGLHVSYPDYAVMPRMAHPDDTVIPWAELKPVLATGFQAP